MSAKEMPSKLKKSKPEPEPSVPKLLPKPLVKRSEGQIPAAFRAQGARPMQLPAFQLVQPPTININIFAGSSAAGSSGRGMFFSVIH